MGNVCNFGEKNEFKQKASIGDYMYCTLPLEQVIPLQVPEFKIIGEKINGSFFLVSWGLHGLDVLQTDWRFQAVLKANMDEFCATPFLFFCVRMKLHFN